ncbi:MAG: ACT domain-containing protein, partial [Candidatus Obscuribacterales bacterium]|nr:ACT domain-containing protein [Candidatus Obscuribacterales bacterium]
PGAGEMPTASAIVGDLVNLATALKLPDFASYFQASVGPGWAQLADPGEWICPRYMRLYVHDHPGVIGQIGSIFGTHEISIRSIIQHGVADSHASIIIVTHAVKEANVNAAIKELSGREFLQRLAACMPIYAGGGQNA